MPLARLLRIADPPQGSALRGPNSLVHQSLHSRLGAEPTNGDGFGVGWYGAGPTRPASSTAPSRRGTTTTCASSPATSSSPLFFTHIRAAIGSAVQQTNCHPFRHGRWLFMHNGYINEFATVKRDLVLAVDPSLYPGDPGPGRHRGAVLPRADLRPRGRPAGGGRAGDRARRGGRRAARGPASRSRGRSRRPTARRIWAFRYSSEGKSRSLFYTTDVPTLRELYPERELFQEVSDDARLIVSEPLGDVAGRLERGARVHLRHRRSRTARRCDRSARRRRRCRSRSERQPPARAVLQSAPMVCSCCRTACACACTLSPSNSCPMAAIEALAQSAATVPLAFATSAFACRSAAVAFALSAADEACSSSLLGFGRGLLGSGGLLLGGAELLLASRRGLRWSFRVAPRAGCMRPSRPRRACPPRPSSARSAS